MFISQKDQRGTDQVLMFSLTREDQYGSEVSLPNIIVQDYALLHDQNYKHAPMLAIAGQDRVNGDHVVAVYTLISNSPPTLKTLLTTPRV